MDATSARFCAVVVLALCALMHSCHIVGELGRIANALERQCGAPK